MLFRTLKNLAAQLPIRRLNIWASLHRRDDLIETTSGGCKRGVQLNRNVADECYKELYSWSSPTSGKCVKNNHMCKPTVSSAFCKWKWGEKEVADWSLQTQRWSVNWKTSSSSRWMPQELGVKKVAEKPHEILSSKFSLWRKRRWKERTSVIELQNRKSSWPVILEIRLRRNLLIP